MSCVTAYLICEVDGSTGMAVAKRGPWTATDPAARDELLALIRSRKVPLDDIRDAGFDSWYCRGVAVDVPGRRFRCYPCVLDQQPLTEVDRALRASPAWTGWDAAVAVGGREEFVDLLPAAARVIAPYHVLDEPISGPVPLPPGEAWFVGWDPVASELTVRYDVYSASWYVEGYDLVTLVTPDRAAFDYRVSGRDTYPVHPGLAWLRAGPAAIDTLLAATPFPPPGDESVPTGVVIDQDLRVIRYWLTSLVPARLLRAVREVWPGWQVRPITHGIAEHRAVTGRPDATPPPGVPVDPRTLRWPRIRVIDAGPDQPI